jgi:hypothetical protein
MAGSTREASAASQVIQRCSVVIKVQARPRRPRAINRYATVGAAVRKKGEVCRSASEHARKAASARWNNAPSDTTNATPRVFTSKAEKMTCCQDSREPCSPPHLWHSLLAVRFAGQRESEGAPLVLPFGRVTAIGQATDSGSCLASLLVYRRYSVQGITYRRFGLLHPARSGPRRARHWLDQLP